MQELYFVREDNKDLHMKLCANNFQRYKCAQIEYMCAQYT